jgi:IS1 family transposase
VAIDPEHRLVLEEVCGRRNRDNCKLLICRVKQRTGGRTDLLITSDGYKLYAECIRECYETPVERPRKPGPGRPPLPLRVMPKDLCHATVIKKRENGRMVKVERQVRIGDEELLRQYLERSTVSTTVNTSFVERNNGTARAFNSRKTRKTCRFSKDWEAHKAMSAFAAYSYNFCWPVRTLAQKVNGVWQKRTPAMSAGLTDHLWTMCEWATFPARASVT